MDPAARQRYEYLFGQLADAALASDPLEVLSEWFAEASAAGVAEPTAVVLATVDAQGLPDARVLLVRQIDQRGVVFYTDRRSAKGRALDGQPVAAMVAHWQALERQIRIRGPVTQIPDEASDAYFASRPRGSQIGAWASHQSQPIAGRAQLEERVAEVTARFDGQPVVRPAYWGGYLLEVDSIEFWQGRESRLHDRIRFSRTSDGWSAQRLQP